MIKLILRQLLFLSLIHNYLFASTLDIPNEFQSGTPARASEVNENFNAVKTSVDDNNAQLSGKQNRVTDSCPTGSSVRVIEENGSVICQTTTTATTISNIPLRMFLQDGLLGYSGTIDTSIMKVPGGFESPGTSVELYAEDQDPVDASLGIFSLIRFDVSSVSTSAESYVKQFDSTFTLTDCNTQLTVTNAKLQIHQIAGGAGLNDASFALRSFHPSAPVFDEQLATWTDANATQKWDKTGTTIESFNDMDKFFDNIDMPRFSGRKHTMILQTDIVKNWICDASTNTGMAIVVRGSNAAMIISSREALETHSRPMLILDLDIR